MADRCDPDEVRAHLEALSREPFRKALAEWMGAAPTEEDIKEWAKTRPDRWAQGLSIVGRMAGYTDKLEIEGSVHHSIQNLSDAEILQRLRDLRADQDAIEGECAEVDEDIPPPE